MAVGLVVSLAAAAHAQNPPPVPPPTPQQQPPPPQDPFPGRTVQGPEGIATTPVVRDEPWSFSLGLNGTYEGNALFSGPSDENEFAHQVQASLGRAWRLRRGDAQLGATATQAFYQDTTALNDFRYSVFGGLGHMITRRLNWSGSAQVTSGLARDAQVLTDAGAILPSTTTARTSSGSSFLSYALSPTSTLGWSLSMGGVGFSSAAFNGGTNLSSAGTYTQRVGRGHTVGATVDYTRTFTGDLSTNVYGVFGVWTYSAGGGWLISATGGVRPYSIPTEDGLRVTSAYSAGVTKPVRRNQTVGVTYAKSVEQAFGLREGNNLVQSVTGTYTTALGRRVSASVGGSFTEAKDPLVPDSSSTGQILQGVLSYRVIQNLSLSVGSSYYRRKVEGAGRSTSSTTFLSLAYNTTF